MAATPVRVNFVLNTTDKYGAPIKQNRYYDVYRPDNLPKTTPVPVVIAMDNGSLFRRKADQEGFVVVYLSTAGNSSGTGWNNGDPRVSGYEDFDYITEVINRVKASDNCNDAFTIGFSTGGHTSLAYACLRPATIRAAASVDEFMQLATDIPTAPLPVIFFHGTSDASVNYTMVRDTADAWRMIDGLLDVPPVTTYESSPLMPGNVSQATWRVGAEGTQVAFVTIIGGSHQCPTPSTETGYDYTDGAWAFFSQFLTSGEDAPKIVSRPVNNTQLSGRPATFWVAATGRGPLSYQWQKNGEDIPGANTNWLTVPATALEDDGATFRAVVSNESGSVTSPAATLTVKAAPNGPAVTIQPADQAVVAGQPAGFTVAAEGTPPFSYQWQKNGVDIAGATAASLDMPRAILPDSGASFTAIVQDANGSTRSNRATLTVTRPPGVPIMLANPVRARVIAGQPGTISVAAWSVSPMSYQWQKAPKGGNMSDIAGANDATYTTPPATLADNQTLFRCVVSNAAGSAASASEMIAVNAAPTAPTKLTSSNTANAQLGTPFSYTIKSSGGTDPITYSATPVPAGLSFDSTSGQISGIPTETGVTGITIGAANSAGKLSSILTLTVGDTAPVLTIEAWRFANFGASATDAFIAGDLADPDGDGFTNLDEFNAGTNPLDATSVPRTTDEPRMNTDKHEFS